MSEPTDEELREQVAKLCGWTGLIGPAERRCGSTPDGKSVNFLPYFQNDLNACHEFEKSTRLHGIWLSYESAVVEQVLKDWRQSDCQSYCNSFPLHATARQRCLAFIEVCRKLP